MGRYIFQPFKTNSKIDCPHCGGRKCYTLYIDTESGELMPAEYGRCDRQNSCGYVRYPNFGQSQVFKTNIPPPPPQSYIDKKVVASCLMWYDKNPFAIAIAEKFGQRGVEVMQMYFIGTTKALGTAFWTINSDLVTCSGKVINYIAKDKEDKLAPFRDKEKMPYYPFKKDDGYFACFFGQHLVKKESVVWIVESEKTAILCAIRWPEFTWLSSGGSTGITVQKVKALRDSGFEGIINYMVDADAAGRESAGRAIANFDTYGYKCLIHDLGEQYQNGEDWGDIILAQHKDGTLWLE